MAYSYYLTSDKRGKQKILDITSSSKYSRMSKFTENRSTIDEIDNFTTKFEDEIALKTHLCENGILDPEDIERPISIRMAIKGQLEKVEYELFYSDGNKYLSDDYLTFKILEKQNDDYFLEKLCTHYRNSYNNAGTINYIRNLLNTRRKYGNVDYVKENIPNTLKEFVINEIYEIDKFTGKPKADPKTGEVKTKQKAKHDLAMFVFRYDEGMKRFEEGYTTEEIKRQTRERLTELKEEFINNNHIKSNPKKRIYKREELEDLYGYGEQMSLWNE